MTENDLKANTLLYRAFRGMGVDGAFDETRDWGEETALAVAWAWETCKGCAHPTQPGTLLSGFYNNLRAPWGAQ